MTLHVLPHAAFLARHLRRIIVEVRPVNATLLTVEEPVFLLVKSFEVRLMLFHHGFEVSFGKSSVIGGKLLLILLQLAEFFFLQNLRGLAFPKSLLSCHAARIVRLQHVSIGRHYSWAAYLFQLLLLGLFGLCHTKLVPSLAFSSFRFFDLFLFFDPSRDTRRALGRSKFLQVLEFPCLASLFASLLFSQSFHDRYNL